MKTHTLITTLLIVGYFTNLAAKQKETTSNKQELSYILLDSSIKLIKNGKYDEALLIVDQAYILAENKNNSERMGACLNNKGIIYGKKGDPVKSIFFYEQALVLLRRANNPEHLYTCLLDIGIAYKKLALYDKALSKLFEAAPYFEQTNDKLRLSSAYNAIGNIYKTEENTNYQKALDFLFQSLKLRKEINHFSGISGSLNNIGTVYQKLGNYDSALHFFKASLEIKLTNPKPDEIATTLSNLGDVYILKGSLKNAENYYLQSYDMRKQENDIAGIANSLYELGYLNLEKDNFRLAEKYFLSSLDTARKVELLDVMLKCYKKLKKVYELERNYQQALYYSDLSIALDEKILGLEKHKSLSQMKVKYETEKIQRQNQNMKEEGKRKETLRQKEQEQNELQKTYMISGIICLIVIIILLSILFTSRHRFAKKLDMVMRELHHRVMNNFQLLLSLMKLQLLYIKDEEAREVITSSSNRISAMALIHSQLYMNKDLTRVNISSYIRLLLDNLVAVYKMRKDKINLVYHIDERINMDVDKAIILGLLINELVTNAFKYAFGSENTSPGLEISLEKQQSSGYQLIVRDNGPGLAQHTKKTLGLTLAEDQVKLLKGQMKTIESAGLAYEITFK